MSLEIGEVYKVYSIGWRFFNEDDELIPELSGNQHNGKFLLLKVTENTVQINHSQRVVDTYHFLWTDKEKLIKFPYFREQHTQLFQIFTKITGFK